MSDDEKSTLEPSHSGESWGARYWWLAIIILFLVLRTFSAFPYFQLGGDQCKYLALAKNFPSHQLYGEHLYLIHQPVYGFLLGLVALVVPVFEAGLLLTLCFGVLNVLAIRQLAIVFGLNRAGVAIAMLYVSLHAVAIAFDSQVSRVSVLMWLMTMACVTYQRWLLSNRERLPWSALAFMAGALATSDQALVLFPAFVVMYLGRLWDQSKNEPASWRADLKPHFLLFAGAGFIYAIWPAVRWLTFRRHEHYPAGIDGTIELVQAASWKCLLQPNFLPFTHLHRSYFTTTSFSLDNLRLVNFVNVPADLVMLPFIVVAAVLVLLVFWSLVVGSRARESVPWVLLLIAGGMYWPCLFSMNKWYGLAFLGPFAVLLGYGVSKIRGTDAWCGRRHGIALTFLVVGLCGAWLLPTRTGQNRVLDPVGGRHFLFGREPITRGSGILERLPAGEEAVFMAPVGLTPEMSYLTGRPFVALPFNPDQLDAFIRHYGVRYVVVSSEYFIPRQDDGWNYVASRKVAAHIASHPERFNRIAQWEERYPDCYADRRFYLFAVMASPQGHD